MTYEEIEKNMTTIDKYDVLIAYDDSTEKIAEFATSIYGMNDETLGNVTYYFYGIDDINEWIHDYA